MVLAGLIILYASKDFKHANKIKKEVTGRDFANRCFDGASAIILHDFKKVHPERDLN